MGYDGTTVNGLSSLGPKMGGKAHGGGVKLDRKSIGKISQSQDDVLSGKETKMENAAMAKSGVISGSHSKGGFMKHAKGSHGQPKGQGYNDRQDESLGMEDGKESGKKQSMKDRRDEREGENKAQGNKPDSLTRYDKGPKKEKLKMVKKDGKNVPFYAADGEGKM